jgi:hypothetical protein
MQPNLTRLGIKEIKRQKFWKRVKNKNPSHIIISQYYSAKNPPLKKYLNQSKDVHKQP